ncbi:MAG: hypothetical protein SVU88_00985 [Candidatus Nanohaloarchaea archaeon]|nr:hypothetical protein [Candidatus Nanohaloarchaea archaeon]
MSKGVSVPLALVILSLILVATALAVLLGTGGGIEGFFKFQTERLSTERCQHRLQEVERGERPPGEIGQKCRSTVSDQRWQQIQESYEEATSE